MLLKVEAKLFYCVALNLVLVQLYNWAGGGYIPLTTRLKGKKKNNRKRDEMGRDKTFALLEYSVLVLPSKKRGHNMVVFRFNRRW